jgi:hypothetical protein
LVAGAIVGAILLWRRVLRVFPKVVVGIGVTLALLGWFVLGPGLPGGRWLTPMPRTTVGPLVENGVAVVVACGKKRGLEGLDAAADYVPEPRTGTWRNERRGDCTVWYHHPPDAEQRENRHLRVEQRRQRAEPPPSEREAGPRFQGWGRDRCRHLEETYLSTCRRLVGG